MGEQKRRSLLGLGATPLAQVRDDKGRVLQEGDEVVLMQPGGCYRVAMIQPVVDPRAPKGLVKLTLVARLEIVCPANGPIEGCIRVRTAEELGGVGPGPAAQVPDGAVSPEGEEPDGETLP
jgi:hypothetical protein